jgi:hypothetical protein
VTEQRRTPPPGYPPLPQARQPRSLAEMAEAVFHDQDLLSRQAAEEDKQRRRSRALDLEDLRDQAEHAAWMGRPMMSALEYHLAVSEEADLREEADRKDAGRRRAAALEARVAELEAELEAQRVSMTRSEQRSSRILRQANEGWAAARDEARRFRDSYYR